jgi:hypothetical protein
MWVTDAVLFAFIKVLNSLEIEIEQHLWDTGR